jgi:hypothetical protein
MKKFLLVALLSVLAVWSVWAQATTQVSGVVSDPSGAVIPAASLEIENLATGLKRTATSDAQGAYAFLQVAPGKYKITVKANGFRTATYNEVQLLVNNPATINPKLEVGQVTETVAVTAEAESLNTVDASLGNAIANKPIVQLPLNARNIVGLLALQPGVVFTDNDDTSSRNGVVNGGKSDQANVTLDGIDVNDQMDRAAFTSVLRMTPDSVQEFRVTTMNANADSGRSSGAQVVLMTRGGSNDLHGSLYWYHRNTVTTANDFFNNMSDVPRPKLIRNLYGGAVSGPIKNNKLFYFANWEGRKDAKESSQSRAVPSMNMRQGILQYRTKDGGTATVGNSDVVGRVSPRGLSAAALSYMQKYPVPNINTGGDGLNIVGYRFVSPTPLRWNTYISKVDYLLNQKHTLFVRGNLQNDNEQGVQQFPGQQASTVTLRNNKGYGVGLTSVFSPTLISNFRYGLTRQGNESTGIGNYTEVTLRGLDPIDAVTRGFVSIIPVHTISEDLNVVHGSHSIQLGGVIRLSQNQRTNYANSYSSAYVNASWLENSGSVLTTPFADMASSSTSNFKYALADVMGLVTEGTGKYNYKVDGTVLATGAPVVRDFRNQEYEFYVQDTWKVNRALTVTGGLRWSLMPPIYEANGQQVSPNVSLGDWFDQRGGLAQAGRSQMEAGRITYYARDKGGRPLYGFAKKNIAPRLSLAYSPQGTEGLSKALFGGPGKTVIRAGWGMYYDLFGSGLMRGFDSTAAGLANSVTNASSVLTIDTAPGYISYKDIPAGLLPAAPAASFPSTPDDLFSITNSLDDKLKAPYNMSMNFSVGRDLSNGWFVQGSYVGRLSRRSLVRRDAAMPTDLKDPSSGTTYYQAATTLARQVNQDVATANVAKVPYWENMYPGAATSSLTATQVAYRQFYNYQYDWTSALYTLDTGAGYGNCTGRNRCSKLGPWASFHPQYSYLSAFSSVGGGNYHAGQFQVRKSFTNGDQVSFNYTWSKSTDLRSYAERAGTATGVLWNPWQPGLQKAVSDYDNTHLFSSMWVYNLPFGKGRKFHGQAGGLADAILGGWQISGMWRWSSGYPISVYELGVWPTNWNNNNYAVWNGKKFASGRTMNGKSIGGTGQGPNMFSDPQAAYEAFDYELPGGVGSRNVLRGDGIFNIDTNLSKRFVMPYSDKHSLQFRWEVFNLTNTARFDVSGGSAGNGADLDISSNGNFGMYTNTLSQARVMQFGLRYEF